VCVREMIRLDATYDMAKFAYSGDHARRNEGRDGEFSEMVSREGVDKVDAVVREGKEYQRIGDAGMLDGKTPDVKVYTFRGKAEVFGRFSGSNLNLEV